jgi:Holliday junction resolvasome RuvABC DNA-binding subunit
VFEGGSAFESAARGLRNLGFREPEVRRALAAVRATLDPAAASTEAVLREALAVAT